MARSITEVAVAMLARREHSEFELRRKLLNKGFDELEIIPVIEQLKTNNLLSEERFTESYINMRRRKGYGPIRIGQELRERGIAAELADDFLDKNSREWRDVMLRQYQKKFGDEPAQEYAERAKRAKYLQNRGFPLDWVFDLTSLGDM